jgi:hypothetical protein
VDDERRISKLKTEFKFTFRLFVILIIPKFQDLEDSSIDELIALYNDFLDKGLSVLQLMPSLTILKTHDISTVA